MRERIVDGHYANLEDYVEFDWSNRIHRTLEERLTVFYGKPLENIERIESTEIDWGKPEGREILFDQKYWHHPVQ